MVFAYESNSTVVYNAIQVTDYMQTPIGNTNVAYAFMMFPTNLDDATITSVEELVYNEIFVRLDNLHFNSDGLYSPLTSLRVLDIGQEYESESDIYDRYYIITSDTKIPYTKVTSA